MLLQFSIALFTGMVAATFVPPVRRAIPRPAEVALWMALLTACGLGIMSVTDKGARDLSSTAAWAAEQLVNTIFGLMLSGLAGWIGDNRFAIVGWLIVAAGADVLALMLLRSFRRAPQWTARVRLRDWMEVPMPATAPVPALVPVTGSRAVGVAARRQVGITALALTTRLHGAVRTQAARLRSVDTSSRLESLRDAAAHVRFAARTWYEGAGRPGAELAGQVVDMRGVFRGLPVRAKREEIDDRDEQRPDSLAS